jgi:hypothetical protein
MSNFFGKDSDEVVVLSTELGSTVEATAGFVLMAFGVIGTSTLLPFLVKCSLLVASMKFIHTLGLKYRIDNNEFNSLSSRKIARALQIKEAGSGLVLFMTTAPADFIASHSGSFAAIGVSNPALSLIALGFAINAFIEFYDNFCQWQERKKFLSLLSLETKETEKIDTSLLDDRDKEIVVGANKSLAKADIFLKKLRIREAEKEMAAAGKLALSSFAKFLGWSCVVTGSFAFAAPLATLWISGGLALVASAHLYNNFFAAPRINDSRKSCLSNISDNNARRMAVSEDTNETETPPYHRWLQVI